MVLGNFINIMVDQLVFFPVYRELNAQLITMGDTKLRLHVPKKHTNVDITYNRGTDLYDIQAFKIKGVQVSTIYNETGIYAENLGEALKSIFKR